MQPHAPSAANLGRVTHTWDVLIQTELEDWDLIHNFRQQRIGVRSYVGYLIEIHQEFIYYTGYQYL